MSPCQEMVNTIAGTGISSSSDSSAKQKHAFPGCRGQQKGFHFCANSSDARTQKLAPGFRSSDRGDHTAMQLTVSLTRIHLLNIKKCGKRLRFSVLRVVEAASSFMPSPNATKFCCCCCRGRMELYKTREISKISNYLQICSHLKNTTTNSFLVRQ